MSGYFKQVCPKGFPGWTVSLPACYYFVFVFSQIESPNTCSVAELERQIDKLTKVKYLYLITDVAMDPPKSQLMKRTCLRFRIEKICNLINTDTGIITLFILYSLFILVWKLFRAYMLLWSYISWRKLVDSLKYINIRTDKNRIDSYSKKADVRWGLLGLVPVIPEV